jgi:radical SAM protein with 4Fe4S-binding SPASM domain
MISMDSGVLYVHPYNHLLAQVIPLGAITSVNSLPCPVAGRYAHEVSFDDLSRARVILLDVHWFFSLPTLPALLREYRRHAPQAAVVVGGLTASIYQELLFDRYDVDFVVFGDAEVGLPPLVDALLRGHHPSGLPNVLSRQDRDPPRRSLTAQELDRLDWLTVDWFPSYRQAAVADHRAVGTDRSWGDGYPLLPLARGCIRNCSFCYGSFQPGLFDPPLRRRSPAALLADLRRIESHRDLSGATLWLGDASFMNPLAKAWAEDRLDLDGRLFFCGYPEPGDLSAVADVFRGAVVCNVIQPADLEPVVAVAAARDTAPAPADFFRYFQEYAQRRAVVWHLSRAAPEGVDDFCVDGKVQTACGIDWTATRPHVGQRLYRTDPGQQLDEVEVAARKLASANLLVALVPSLTSIPVFAFGDDDQFNPLNQPGGDEFEHALVRLCITNLVDHGFYGFDNVELSWGLSPLAGQSSSRWGPCGSTVEGHCSWFFGSHGLQWQGELEVNNDAPLEVSVIPSVSGSEGTISLSRWERARVPCFPLGAAGRRLVRAGGVAKGETIELWLEDGDQPRQGWRLHRSLAVCTSDAAKAQSDLQSGGDPGAASWPLVLGYECNNNCLHCHVRGRSQAMLSLAEATRTIDQARRQGIDTLVFDGGEPTVQDQLFDIVRYARRAGMDQVRLSTNGRRCSSSTYAAELATAGVTEIFVTLQGADKEVHDRITRVPGSFVQTVQGLRQLQAAGFRDLTINLPLHRDMIGRGSLVRAVKLFSRLGVRRFRLQFLIPPEDRGEPVSLPARGEAERAIKSLEGQLPEQVTVEVVEAPSRFAVDAEPHRRDEEADGPQGGCSNSYNYEVGEALPFVDVRRRDCPARSLSWPRGPHRAAMLLGQDLRVYRCKTRDFTEDQIQRVKELEQLYWDTHVQSAALDLHREQPLKLCLHEECRHCEHRPRCAGVMTVQEPQPYAADEAWLADEMTRLRGHLLDIGCGEGVQAALLDQLAGDGTISYEGLDPDREALARLRRRGRPGTYRCAAIEDFVAEPASFEVLLALRSVNHFVDVSRAFSVMADILRPGGVCLLIDSPPFALLRESEQVRYADRHAHGGQEHHRNWTSQDLLRLLQHFPFRVLFHRPVDQRTSNQWLLKLERC